MEIFALSLLVLLNGFFALSEIALVSSKRTRLEQYKKSGSKGAAVALQMLDDSENFLSAIQVGITLIGIVTGVYGGINIAGDVAPFFMQFEMTSPYAGEIALILTVIVITYFSIVIGELVPKTIALSKPEKIAKSVAPIVYYFSKVFYPFVQVLSWSTSVINNVIGVKKQSDSISEAELRQMIKTASHEGVIEKEQNLIHEKVFYFADKKAKHLMTHRTDVEWVDLGKPAKEVHQSILLSKHSKIILCKQSLDDFSGVIALKEYLLKSISGKPFSIKDIITDPIVVPENASAQKVLDLFRTKQTNLAIVVNEYGSFEGIVTLHDIMENLVGSIPNGSEQEEPDIFIREDKSALVSGEAPIETLLQVMEDFVIDFETINYSTVAGFVLDNINKIPQVGDKFIFGEYEIEIMDTDLNKIDKILVKKKD